MSDKMKVRIVITRCFAQDFEFETENVEKSIDEAHKLFNDLIINGKDMYTQETEVIEN